MSAEDRNRPYIDVVREELQQYTQSLLRENEKLRAMSAALESDKRRMELEVIDARAVLEQKEELRRTAETFDAARAELLNDAARARQERDAATTELNHLRARFEDVASENHKYAAQYHQIELHSSNLSNLYVASYQLHSSVDRDAVLCAIQEIVVNLIGSEEVAILEFHPEQSEFRLAASFGVDESTLISVKAGHGILGQQLAGGELLVNDSPADGEGALTACIPLKIGESIIGGILVFRLLEHKQGLQTVDHELFELLAVHASTALYCANLHQTFASAVAV